MDTSRLFLVGLALGLLGGGPAEAADDARVANARARLAAAQKVYKGLQDRWRSGPPADDLTKLSYRDFAELSYRWSVRWLEAQQETSPRQADQVAAAEAHLARMRQLAKMLRAARGLGGFVSPVEVAAGEFYRLDAERALLRLKKKWV